MKTADIDKRGVAYTPIDIIAGVLLVIAGVTTAMGNINLGTVLAGIGLLIEAVKILLKQGF